MGQENVRSRDASCRLGTGLERGLTEGWLSCGGTTGSSSMHLLGAMRPKRSTCARLRHNGG